jgi:hypothetical protein
MDIYEWLKGLGEGPGTTWELFSFKLKSKVPSGLQNGICLDDPCDNCG